MSYKTTQHKKVGVPGIHKDFPDKPLLLLESHVNDTNYLGVVSLPGSEVKVGDTVIYCPPDGTNHPLCRIGGTKVITKIMPNGRLSFDNPGAFNPKNCKVLCQQQNQFCEGNSQDTCTQYQKLGEQGCIGCGAYMGDLKDLARIGQKITDGKKTLTVTGYDNNNMYQGKWENGGLGGANPKYFKPIKEQLLHQKWKDLYDQGVTIEAKFKSAGDECWSTDLSGPIISTFNNPTYEYRRKEQQMNPFKVGDKVRSLTTLKHVRKKGEVFTVLKVSETSIWYENSTCSHRLDEWELVESTEQSGTNKPKQEETIMPKVGDKVVAKCYIPKWNYTKGTIQTITKIDGNKIWVSNTDNNHWILRVCWDLYTGDAEASNKSTQKEQTMTNMTLNLLLAMMAGELQEKPDATNSKFVGIVMRDDEYLGYMYCDSKAEAKEVMAKPENEGKQLHLFKKSTVLTQKPREVIEIT